MITVSKMQKAGQIYDSSKYVQLGSKISSDIAKRTNNRYIVKYTASGKSLKLTIKKRNEQTGVYGNTTLNEQEVLAGKVISFLNSNSVSHEIKVN